MGILDSLFVPNIEKMKARKDIEGLTKALGYQKSLDVRASAADALGEIGERRAVKPLLAALQDKVSRVRSAAARALGEIGDSKAIDSIIAVLRDTDSETRRSAVEALAKLGDERAVDPLLNLLSDSWSSVNLAAMEALEKLQVVKARPREHIVRVYIDALNRNSSPRLCIAAAEILGKLGDQRAIRPLLDALSDSHSNVRSAAIVALRELDASKSEITEGYFRALDGAELDATLEALQALRRLEVHEGKLKASLNRRIQNLKGKLGPLQYKLNSTIRILGEQDYSGWDHSWVGAGGGAHWVEDIRQIINPEYERVEKSVKALEHEIKVLESELDGTFDSR